MTRLATMAYTDNFIKISETASYAGYTKHCFQLRKAIRMKNWGIFVKPALFLLIIVCIGCGDDVDKKSTDTAVGVMGGECYPNNTCDAGLECRSEICVWDGTGSDPTKYDTNGTDSQQQQQTPEETFANCISCGESKCSAESSSCTSGCKTILDCVTKCAIGTDANCLDNCDLTSITADEATAYQAYFTCISQQCISECSPPTEQPEDTNKDTDTTKSTDPPVGGTCDDEGEHQGSCANSNLQVCTNGNWTAGDCAGCDIVSPSSTCERAYPLTFLQTILSNDAVELTSATPNDLDFTKIDSKIKAEWYVEADHVGVIQFIFSEPVDPNRIKIDSSSNIEFVTLESPDGQSGCQYIHDYDGTDELTRYNKIDEDGEGYSYIAWYGCWGEYSTYETEEPIAFTTMNIRTYATTTNETLNLTISEILL